MTGQLYSVCYKHVTISEKHFDIPPNLLSQNSVTNNMNRKNKKIEHREIGINESAVKHIFVKLLCPRLAILLNCIYIQIG